MEKINKEELMKINGGGLHIGLGIGIFAGISFIVGVIDGYVRPLVCRR